MVQQIEDELTIQQVAELTGVSAYTLRYYERIGLLDEVERASSGHRRYTEHDLAWISMLKRLRRTGMSIRKMQEYADLRRQGLQSLPQRLAFLERHQQEVEAHLRETAEHLAVIEAKIQLHRVQLAHGKETNLDEIKVGDLSHEEHLAEIEAKIHRYQQQEECEDQRELDLMAGKQKVLTAAASRQDL
ncbi:MAG TPA: MerR family transcriptional regulator [Ktedonosporobacter sp.]|nr:MerR family transcriptional regulator [Ktedonosporobacter sp.]